MSGARPSGGSWRGLGAPHMALCALVLVLGVVLLFTGAAALGFAVILLTCIAVVAWLLGLSRTPGDGGGWPADARRRHRPS